MKIFFVIIKMKMRQRWAKAGGMGTSVIASTIKIKLIKDEDEASGISEVASITAFGILHAGYILIIYNENENVKLRGQRSL